VPPLAALLYVNKPEPRLAFNKAQTNLREKESQAFARVWLLCSYTGGRVPYSLHHRYGLMLWCHENNGSGLRTFLALRVLGMAAQLMSPDAGRNTVLDKCSHPWL
jgi:hypothetical protein